MFEGPPLGFYELWHGVWDLIPYCHSKRTLWVRLSERGGPHKPESLGHIPYPMGYMDGKPFFRPVSVLPARLRWMRYATPRQRRATVVFMFSWVQVPKKKVPGPSIVVPFWVCTPIAETKKGSALKDPGTLVPNMATLPAPPNDNLRCPNYHPIETIRP